jgi:hypothetical protein
MPLVPGPHDKEFIGVTRKTITILAPKHGEDILRRSPAKCRPLAH